MIKLENLQNAKLSSGIRNLSPIQYETNQVKNKLLDGSFHIQTIGEPLKYITFEILSNHNQVDLLNQTEYKGEDLRLIIDNKFYKGMIDEVLEWERMTKRYKNDTNVYYMTNIRLNISEEGSI